MVVPNLSQAPDLTLFLFALAAAVLFLVIFVDPVWGVFKWLLLFFLKALGIATLTYFIFKWLRKKRDSQTA